MDRAILARSDARGLSNAASGPVFLAAFESGEDPLL
jgi:hypothetical protein